MPINSMLSRRALLLAAADPTSLATTASLPGTSPRSFLSAWKPAFRTTSPAATKPQKLYSLTPHPASSLPSPKLAPGTSSRVQCCTGTLSVQGDRIGTDLVTVVLNVQNGKRRILPMALAGVPYNGRHTLCLNYARLARLRPVVGIRGVTDHSTPGNHPEDDLSPKPTGASRTNIQNLASYPCSSSTPVSRRTTSDSSSSPAALMAAVWNLPCSPL